ncbi:antitoxin [Kribbella sp. CA-293567]|uniref:antitoxin n=1 Tax=Kribbella sp. CA-293567 TaxID=3002436 RepID=UPI0022DE9566|nr:antitoxin [Kribbella sp. CA-293567]WBQ02468.1 antitoxin [Kribbella sp. CA-293567]
MNDFQEQAKNWLRNVVAQNPDKIKAGVEKAGDLIDKQTGGKYAEKVDSVQEKVGGYVDSHGKPSQPSGDPGNTSTEQNGETTAAADEATKAETGDGAPDAATQPGSSGAEQSVGSTAGSSEASEADATGAAADEAVDEASPEAVDGRVVGGEVPDVEENPSSSAGSGTEGAATGGTATGTSDGGLPGPR